MENGITYSDILSISALIISLLSFGFSTYIGLRDRPHLITSCIIYDTEPPQIKIRAVNIGRRPLVLYCYGVTYETGNFTKRLFETFEMRKDGDREIEKQEHGRRLIEHDYFEEVITPEHDIYKTPFSDGSLPMSIWFEDTSGRRYKITGLRKHLDQLNKYILVMRKPVSHDKT
jgi:hypothetical protein